MNLFFRHAASLWRGKNCRVREPVVHMLQSFCHTSSKLDLTFALSSVGDQAISVGVLLKLLLWLIVWLLWILLMKPVTLDSGLRRRKAREVSRGRVWLYC
jgi:hypothetical protein